MDTAPGDRASDCRGMMEPSKMETKGGDYDLTHKCVKCGYEKRNKMSPEDNFDVAIKANMG